MPANQWANAYLAQAEEDLDAAKAVAAQGVAPSTLCMLLQMVFEKIAKAALLESEHWDVTKAQSTHLAIGSPAGTRLFAALERHAKWLGIARYRWKYLQLKVQELEQRHPDVYRQRSRAEERGDAFARHGQLEYPWQRGTDQVRLPAAHLTIAQELRDRKERWGSELLRLAASLIDEFDQIFGG